MANSRRAEQLSLAIDDTATPALPRRLRPMLPLKGAAPFDDADFFFEPWWPGASALLFVEDGTVRLQTEHLVDPLGAFPELSQLGRQFHHDAVIVEGTLLALDEEGRPDADLLRSLLADRNHLDEPQRAAGSAAFVASDMLYADGRPIVGESFGERRGRLARELIESDNFVVSRGLRGEGLTLAEAVASMGLTDISARLLSGRYRPGQQDETWLRLPVTEAPVAPRRPLLALLQRLPL